MTDLYIRTFRGVGLGLLFMAAVLPVSAKRATISVDANIYGWNGYASTSYENSEMGWYRFGTNGEEKQLWADNFLAHYGTYFNVGYIREGKICGYYGNASAATYLEFDMEKGGNPVRIEYMEVEGEYSRNNLMSGAYNSADDCVYGFSSNVDLSELYLVKASAADPTNISIVRELPEGYTMMVSCCFCPKDNKMYGIDLWGDFVRCDVNGNFELLGEMKDLDYGGTPEMALWESGMTYSPKDDAFIWNRQFSDFTSHLVKIDAETFKWSKIADIALWHQYTFLDTTDHDGDTDGPARGECIEMTFSGVSPDGSVTYKMPTKLSDGSDAPATMSWTASCGEFSKNGTAGPGETVKVEYAGLPQGNAVFNFRADAGEARGRTLVNSQWIGNDNPSRPRNVTLSPVSTGKYKLTWEAPERGAHYGYVDKSKLLYAAFLDGKQINTPIPECELDVELPTDVETRGYSFLVVAVANGLQSEVSRSNTVYTGRGYNLPYYIAPDDDDATMVTVINVDNDRSRWNYQDEIGSGKCFFTNRDWDNPGDDYLITPPLYIDNAAATYQISFEIRYQKVQKTEEYYDIWLGTAPTVDGIREQQIVGKTAVKSHDYETVTYQFQPSSTGPHYIGIHYIGEADQGGVYVRNINISKASGVESVTDNSGISVRGLHGEIAVSTAAPARIEVFAPDGRAVAAEKADGDTRISVASGIYIVRVAGKTFKVSVK